MLDHKQIAIDLATLLDRYRGQKLLGVIDGIGVVEIVFSERRDGGNLLTLRFDENGHIVQVGHGFVVAPADYVDACGVHLEEVEA